MTKVYSVVEVFSTLQGEGVNAGRSAIFVRFAGCNLWSGHDEHRDRDAERNGATCPKFCDTDFVSRGPEGKYTLSTLLAEIRKRLPMDLVVFTGGEPLLQLDEDLVEECNAMGLLTCVETNGTVELRPALEQALGHICVSPKVAPHLLKVERGTELKVVVPAYDPREFLTVARGFKYWFVSPEAATTSRGRSLIVKTAEHQAARWCMENPPWRLSLQTHKHLEIP